MIHSEKLEQRILDLMRNKNARLVFHFSGSGGVYCESPVLYRIAVEHDGRELTLATVEKWDSDGFPYHAYSAIAERLRKHTEIRKGYPGYRGNFDRRWREVYEHRTAPQPAWVSDWSIPYPDDNY